MKKRYDEIIHYFLNEIQTGNWPEGGKIPSQIQLAKKLDCSRSSIERAVKELTAEGWLSATQGGGTYAAKPEAKQKIRNILSVVDSGEMLARDSFSTLFLNLNLSGLPCQWVTAEYANSHLHQLLKRDTAVISYMPDVPQHQLLAELRDAGVPLLLLNRDYNSFDRVTTDTRAGIADGLKWLQREGMTELALLSYAPMLEKPYLPERIGCCYELCMELDITLKKENVLKAGIPVSAPELEKQIAAAFFRQKGRKIGIFATNCELAQSVLNAAASSRMKPGTDFLLLTFDWIGAASATPGVAFLIQQYQLFCEEMELWIQRLNTSAKNPFVKRIPPVLQICKNDKNQLSRS